MSPKEKTDTKKSGLFMAALVFSLSVQTAAAGWTTAKRLTWTPAESWNPSIAVGASGNVHVVWYDDTPGNCQIYCLKGK